MPVRRLKDAKGVYYQWGSHGAKYYVKDHGRAARSKAAAQGRAAYANGYKK